MLWGGIYLPPLVNLTTTSRTTSETTSKQHQGQHQEQHKGQHKEHHQRQSQEQIQVYNEQDLNTMGCGLIVISLVLGGC